MAVSYLGVLLQVMAGSVASFVIGMMWFSPSCLGRTWWSYSFPNKKYGECGKQNTVYLHLLCTGSYVAQSIILSCTINGLLSSTKLHPLLSESLPLPLLCASLISILVACNSYPHYLYAGKPTMLFLICVGYDALQVTMATLVIYSIAVIMMYD